MKYCYIAIFFAAIQNNMADLGHRYIAGSSDNLNAKTELKIAFL